MPLVAMMHRLRRGREPQDIATPGVGGAGGALLRASIDGVVGEDPPDWWARSPWPPLSETDLRLLERNG